MRRHVLVNVLKHRGRIKSRALRQGAVFHRLLPTCGDVSLELLLQCSMAILGPFAESNQMLLQTYDGITQRPGLPFVLRTVPRRVITRGMCRCAVGDMLDESGTAAHSRA